MKVEIDKYAGFCFGVINAIEIAEKYSAEENGISCLGQIVHNSQEEKRLNKLGMKTVNYDDLQNMNGQRLLIRAHGEPPETYFVAKKFNIEIIDATCPIVLALQKRIKQKFDKMADSQIVIYGKKGHAEVNGLVGQTKGTAIVISSLDEASLIDLSKQTFVFSQTTSNSLEYENIETFLLNESVRINGHGKKIKVFKTICPSVKNRIPRLKEFCEKLDIIIFVSDKKSSNGKMLYSVCKENNPRSYFISSPNDLKAPWFEDVRSVGISGATSTPLWLMKDVKRQILFINKK
ncbi:MAG: 4-hydroxy-3-methylbut-2-enyl diphosphate reductase [Bacteroidales bacterium]|nr:4-hydroxy-3-methylbut-2-enyl diphosphate reductase [Bacteroidales bacterium]